MALWQASIAMATSVLGTSPPCPVCTRRSTAATSRTNGFLLSALRYSGSVFSLRKKRRESSADSELQPSV
jgi:hypothetical protein